ncbi:periplasmic heavy metal sensor [Kaistia granuli]|uniref:periplasmic heavy metal sensor n=1 Tax=Kaistia granuli TaxID=363259 RepID=UPI00036F6797|nr:periplasmic heavy metal sensor [Kaistia granuli]
MALTVSPKARRTLLWCLLVASLGLNAFFVGATVTDLIRFRHGGDEKGPRIIRTELRWLKDRLSPDAIETIEAQLAPLKPDIVARLDQLKKLRSELNVLVAAPVPDKAAIDAHLRDIRLEVGAMQEQIQSRTFEAVQSLPAEQRAALATAPSK